MYHSSSDLLDVSEKGETLDDWSQAGSHTFQMRVLNIGPTCRCPSSHWKGQ